ncbi:MAG: alkaline phosphatase [Actinomycetota bacterium]|nr:alkaline phosphatase [Actinomycetota bacterium]
MAGAATALASCSGSGSGSRGVALVAVPDLVEVGSTTRLPLRWSPAKSAARYDVELNGVVVVSGLSERATELAYGDGATGFVEGVNTWRVRAVTHVDSVWSAPSRFEVLPLGAVRARRFDHEDDGAIALTTKARSGTTLSVSSAAALGSGKGLIMRGTSPISAVASKDHRQQSLATCWVRLAVRPMQWGKPGTRVHLLRVRSSKTGDQERLVWSAGHGVSLDSVPKSVQDVPVGKWSQVQLGVLPDGTVELWSFDGQREHLVGRGSNPLLAGAVKDAVALGNNLTHVRSTFEIHLDAFAVSEQRLPWANPGAPVELARPARLDPVRLPPAFSFCFGSCNNAVQTPFGDTAVGVAARLAPDFFVHLGDYCYPDSNAYQQTVAGYHAIWSDMLFEEQLARLHRTPWIYLASDHDMGGNDCDATTCNPLASQAFEQWQSNDPATDGVGRYGSALLDRGRVLLLWTEGIAFRSPLTSPDGPAKTVLGPKQKAWLLRQLATTTAKLVIVASQTSFGHVTGSDWAPYATERAEVIHACQTSPARHVRFVSGDYHHACWARFGAKVAEWVAAPMAEFPEPAYARGTLVDVAAEATIGPGFPSRPEALRSEGEAAMNDASSVGRVSIDGPQGVATFEVLDNRGRVRVDGNGFAFRERLQYV